MRIRCERRGGWEGVRLFYLTSERVARTIREICSDLRSSDSSSFRSSRAIMRILLISLFFFFCPLSLSGNCVLRNCHCCACTFAARLSSFYPSVVRHTLGNVTTIHVNYHYCDPDFHSNAFSSTIRRK